MISEAFTHNCHVIEATIRYLTTAEGGRRKGVASGYRGQFYYDGEDYNGFQYFPDYKDDEFVSLGDTVRAYVSFSPERWELRHSKRIYEGMPFAIREGNRVVGRGIVTSLKVDPENSQ